MGKCYTDSLLKKQNNKQIFRPNIEPNARTYDRYIRREFQAYPVAFLNYVLV